MSHTAVIMVDTTGAITRWDDGAEALFGYRAGDVVGHDVELLVPPHLVEAHRAGFRRAMAEPVVKDLAADLPVVCADGQVRTYAGRLLALSDGLGTAVGAMAIYTDAAEVGFSPFG